MRNTHAHAESPDSFPSQRLCSQIGRVVGTSDLLHFRSAESECGLGRRHHRVEPSQVLFIHESLWWRLCRAPETVRTATPQSHASDTTPRPSDVPLLAVYSSATPLLLAGASAGSFDHDSTRCDPRTIIPATHGQLCRADPRPKQLSHVTASIIRDVSRCSRSLRLGFDIRLQRGCEADRMSRPSRAR